MVILLCICGSAYPPIYLSNYQTKKPLSSNTKLIDLIPHLVIRLRHSFCFNKYLLFKKKNLIFDAITTIGLHVMCFDTRVRDCKLLVFSPIHILWEQCKECDLSGSYLSIYYYNGDIMFTLLIYIFLILIGFKTSFLKKKKLNCYLQNHPILFIQRWASKPNSQNTPHV